MLYLFIFVTLLSYVAAASPPAEGNFKDSFCTDPRTMKKHAAYSEWADAYSCTRHRCQPGGRNLAIYTVGCKRVEAPESAIECEEVVEDTNMQFPFCCTRLRCLVVVRGEVWTRVLGQPWETLPAAPWSHMYKMKKPPPGDTAFLPKVADEGPIYELQTDTENNENKESSNSNSKGVLRASKTTATTPECNDVIKPRSSVQQAPAPDIVIALSTGNDNKKKESRYKRGRKRFDEEQAIEPQQEELDDSAPMQERAVQSEPASDEKYYANAYGVTQRVPNKQSLQDLGSTRSDTDREESTPKPRRLQALVDAIGTRMKDIETVVQRMSDKVHQAKTSRERQESLNSGERRDTISSESNSRRSGDGGPKPKKSNPDNDQYQRFSSHSRGSKYLHPQDGTTEAPLYLEDNNLTGYFSDASNIVRRNPKTPPVNGPVRKWRKKHRFRHHHHRRHMKKPSKRIRTWAPVYPTQSPVEELHQALHQTPGTESPKEDIHRTKTQKNRKDTEQNRHTEREMKHKHNSGAEKEKHRNKTDKRNSTGTESPKEGMDQAREQKNRRDTEQNWPTERERKHKHYFGAEKEEHKNNTEQNWQTETEIKHKHYSKAQKEENRNNTEQNWHTEKKLKQKHYSGAQKEENGNKTAQKWGQTDVREMKHKHNTMAQKEEQKRTDKRKWAQTEETKHKHYSAKKFHKSQDLKKAYHKRNTKKFKTHLKVRYIPKPTRQPTSQQKFRPIRNRAHVTYLYKPVREIPNVNYLYKPVREFEGPIREFEGPGRDNREEINDIEKTNVLRARIRRIRGKEKEKFKGRRHFSEPSMTYMAPVETRRKHNDNSEDGEKKKKKHGHKKRKPKGHHKRHRSKEDKRKRFNKVTSNEVERNVVSIEDASSAMATK